MKDREFEDWARARLEEHEAALSAEIRRRLRLGREVALESSTRLRWRLPMVAGLATAALLLLAVGLWWPHSLPTVPGEPEDLVLLIEDDPEFIADLEFYEWLESQDGTG